MAVACRATLMVLAIAGSMTMGTSMPARAEDIYKSVDRSGHVTYSSTPTADAVRAEPITLPDEPTAEDVLAAEEQYRLIQSVGAALEKERKQREQEQARREAKERAQQAASSLTIVYIPVPVFLEPIHRPPPTMRRPPPVQHRVMPIPPKMRSHHTGTEQ